MAYVVVFPDQEAFQQGLIAMSGPELAIKVLQPPCFCESLVAPSIRVTGVNGPVILAAMLAGRGVSTSGILRYAAFKREIRDAAPPDLQSRQMMGKIRVESLRSSVSDAMKLRVEVSWAHDVGHLMPYVARVIRGGSYRPEAMTVAFQEEHRLIALSPLRMVISRAEDLLDAWTMLRSWVDLLRATAERRSAIRPETRQRRGIGAVEIFRRLPGTNCGRCESPNCMEFAMRLFMGSAGIEECALLSESDWAAHRESVAWLMGFIGPSPMQEPPRSKEHRSEGILQK